MTHAPTRIVLVTGASRGIGAEVATRLADPDTHVIVNHREGADRAARTVAAIRAAGGQASALAVDISDETGSVAMVESIAARFGRLDTMILTASEGPGLGADPGYAMRFNRDAQRRLAVLAMPLMPAGGRIVFVTTHQAHFYPHKAVPKGYAAVAASRRAGESALYALRSDFERAGVQFTTVSGDLIDGTVSAAVANAATIPHPSGVVYVGGADYLMTA